MPFTRRKSYVALRSNTEYSSTGPSHRSGSGKYGLKTSYIPSGNRPLAAAQLRESRAPASKQLSGSSQLVPGREAQGKSGTGGKGQDYRLTSTRIQQIEEREALLKQRLQRPPSNDELRQSGHPADFSNPRFQQAPAARTDNLSRRFTGPLPAGRSYGGHTSPPVNVYAGSPSYEGYPYEDLLGSLGVQKQYPGLERRPYDTTFGYPGKAGIEGEMHPSSHAPSPPSLSSGSISGASFGMSSAHGQASPSEFHEFQGSLRPEAAGWRRSPRDDPPPVGKAMPSPTEKGYFANHNIDAEVLGRYGKSTSRRPAEDIEHAYWPRERAKSAIKQHLKCPRPVSRMPGEFPDDEDDDYQEMPREHAMPSEAPLGHPEPNLRRRKSQYIPRLEKAAPTSERFCKEQRGSEDYGETFDMGKLKQALRPEERRWESNDGSNAHSAKPPVVPLSNELPNPSRKNLDYARRMDPVMGSASPSSVDQASIPPQLVSQKLFNSPPDNARSQGHPPDFRYGYGYPLNHDQSPLHRQPQLGSPFGGWAQGAQAGSKSQSPSPRSYGGASRVSPQEVPPGVPPQAYLHKAFGGHDRRSHHPHQPGMPPGFSEPQYDKPRERQDSAVEMPSPPQQEPQLGDFRPHMDRQEHAIPRRKLRSRQSTATLNRAKTESESETESEVEEVETRIGRASRGDARLSAYGGCQSRQRSTSQAPTSRRMRSRSRARTMGSDFTSISRSTTPSNIHFEQGAEDYTISIGGVKIGVSNASNNMVNLRPGKNGGLDMRIRQANEDKVARAARGSRLLTGEHSFESIEGGNGEASWDEGSSEDEDGLEEGLQQNLGYGYKRAISSKRGAGSGELERA